MILVASSSSGSIPTYPAIASHPKRVQKFRSLPASPNPNRVSDLNTVASLCQPSKRRCECYDMHNELVPYAQAWSWQKSIVRERKALKERNEDCFDTLIILQHYPVYTLGTGSSEEYLNFDLKAAPFDVYRTERGGEVTYHGPGQLVMYPIINLHYHKMDLHWYLRALEEVVIRTLSSTFSIQASRLDGLTGVWVGDRKLAAVGIRASQWMTYHGLALNVTTDLAPFHRIIPCGIRDRQVGNVKELLGGSSSSDGRGANDVNHADDQELIDVAYKSLVEDFCEVFQVDLRRKSISFPKITDGKTLLLQT